MATSELLERLSAEALAAPRSDRITCEEFLDKLSECGFALAILLCALPNFFPVNVPGVSTLFSALIGLLTVQLMLGFKHMWLPDFIGKRSFSEKAFAAGLEKCLPMIRKIERVIHPRLEWVTEGIGLKITCLFLLLHTFVLALPLAFIPFSNAIPAYAIALIALGILERDGVVTLIGIIGGTLAIYFYSEVIISVCRELWLYIDPYL